jgi:hypothetical protein
VFHENNRTRYVAQASEAFKQFYDGSLEEEVVFFKLRSWCAFLANPNLPNDLGLRVDERWFSILEREAFDAAKI